MITFDTQTAYKVPFDGREDYFELIDNHLKNCKALSNSNINAALNTQNDPIIIFDFAYFNQKQVEFIKLWMNLKVKALNITETLTEE